MNFLRKCYCLLVDWSGPFVLSLVLLLARIVIGWGFYQAGHGKVQDIQKPIHFFEKLNIVFPVANAYFVSYLECIGGILMLIGFFSRPICLMLAVDMIVAYATAHRENAMALFTDQDMSKFADAAPFWFLVGSLLVWALGPGWFSIDGIIKGLMPKRRKEITPQDNQSTNPTMQRPI